VIIQGVLIGKLVPRFGEKKLALFAAVMFGTGMLVLATAGAVWQVLLGIAFFATGTGFLNPSLSSLVSQMAADDERGIVMGHYQAASALGRVGGPSISGMLYTDVSFAAPFALGGLIMLPVLMLIGSTQIVTRAASKPGAST
jgi:DHA1 family multidrug resistance protein-like MFS transporter